MSNFAPLISIVIPVYNGANYMREAIDSAIAQTYVNKEIIVINDGSRDDGKTLEIARSYGDKIRLIDKPNGGVATALNAGIDAMTGDYFSWLSHDDIYPTNKLEKQVAFLSALDDKNTILFGDFTIINEKSEFMGNVSIQDVDTRNMTFEIYAKQCIHGCSLLVPKTAFERAGKFRTDLPTTQDYDLWLRMSRHVPFAHQSGIFVHSRQHAEQGSRTLQHHQEVLDFYLNNLSHLTPEWLDTHYSPAEVVAKYDILLKKFSAAPLKPAFSRVLNQALIHLLFKKSCNTICFVTKAWINFYAGSLIGVIKRMIPLQIKNLLRRNLNAPRAGEGKPNHLDFVKIYKKNIFGSKESRSGSGSTMEQTAYIREIFPQLFRELGVKTILDVPCGDFNWMQTVDLSGIHYIGGDIVPQLIEKDNAQFGSAERDFRMLNIITDDLPKADVILCRDCLVHLNFESGLKAIRNFKRSGSTYLLTTTFTDREVNEDLFGIWRTLNLQKAPYNLPTPVKMINEKCTEGRNQYTDKSLGLWRLEDIQV